MHDLDIIKINECLVAKNLLTNVTKTNKHLNVVTFVCALMIMDVVTPVQILLDCNIYVSLACLMIDYVIKLLWSFFDNTCIWLAICQ